MGGFYRKIAVPARYGRGFEKTSGTSSSITWRDGQEQSDRVNGIGGGGGRTDVGGGRRRRKPEPLCPARRQTYGRGRNEWLEEVEEEEKKNVFPSSRDTRGVLCRGVEVAGGGGGSAKNSRPDKRLGFAYRAYHVCCATWLDDRDWCRAPPLAPVPPKPVGVNFFHQSRRIIHIYIYMYTNVSLRMPVPCVYSNTHIRGYLFCFEHLTYLYT